MSLASADVVAAAERHLSMALLGAHTLAHWCSPTRSPSDREGAIGWLLPLSRDSRIGSEAVQSLRESLHRLHAEPITIGAWTQLSAYEIADFTCAALVHLVDTAASGVEKKVPIAGTAVLAELRRAREEVSAPLHSLDVERIILDNRAAWKLLADELTAALSSDRCKWLRDILLTTEYDRLRVYLQMEAAQLRFHSLPPPDAATGQSAKPIETSHAKTVTNAIGASPHSTTDEIHHAPDFSSVKVPCGRYVFTPTQRLVIEALWKEYERRKEGLGQRHLLTTAGSESKYLKDLYKDHSAWGTFIVRSRQGKDIYCLSFAMPKTD